MNDVETTIAVTFISLIFVLAAVFVAVNNHINK
jgi:hypothetical protein